VQSILPLISQRNFDAKELRGLDRRRAARAAGTLAQAGNASPRPNDAEGAEDDELGFAMHGDVDQV
jgi:hypothetical protein